MKKVISPKFRSHIATQIAESINEPANNVYYLTASKHTPYSTGDDNVPQPTTSTNEFEILPYAETIFGKKITPNDVAHMAPRYNWTYNTVYSIYDDQDGDLFTKQFYTVVDAGSMFYVYKVLDNNGGAKSTVQPSSISESACNFITTGDGYKWKLMYSVPQSTFNKFATSDYMPVFTSANVAGNSVSGAIDVVLVTNNGSNYVSTLTGQFTSNDVRNSIPTISGNSTTYRLNSNASANADFYINSSLYLTSGTGAGQIKQILSYDAVTRVITINTPFTSAPDSTTAYTVAPTVIITGDGTGACAYAVVASNSSVNNYVSSIQVVSRGSGYSYASATIAGNTGGVSNTSSARVIISPVGGHGSDAIAELGSSQLGISVTFANNESGFIPTSNDYRQFSILKDPLFKDVILTMNNQSGTFTVGENIHQMSYKVLTGTVSTNTANVNVVGTDTDFGNSIAAGDNVIIFDTANNLQCLRTVAGVTNSTSLTLTSYPAFNVSFGKISQANILCSGVNTGNTTPYMNLGNTEPKFVTGKYVIGETSGSWANVTAINVQEKSYNNWSTFDNRTRVSYTSNTGAFASDALVYQTDVSLSNAYFHSANSTYVFLTSEKGPINADPASPLIGGSASYTLGSVKYHPDIEKGSGQIIYIENNIPITRSNSQSETIRIVLEF